MFEVGLLLAIVTQLSPYGLAGNDIAPGVKTAIESTQDELRALKPPFQLIVDFPEINGLRPGSPVLVEGNLVGHVKKISSKMTARNRPNRNASSGRTFEVSLDLDFSVSQKLSLGTCALQALPMTDAKRTHSPVVELFVPKHSPLNPKLALLHPGDRIPGFASYEQFWRLGPEKTKKTS